MGILDLVFPKRCVNCKKLGDYVCQNCFSYISFDPKSLCLVCDRASYNNLTHPSCLKTYTISGCFSALNYNKIAQKLIYNFKYKPYLTDLKPFLSNLFYESIIQNENFMSQVQIGKWVFVPIPLFNSKLRKRGYNQSEILAKSLSKKFNPPAIAFGKADGGQGFATQNLLERTRDTKTQFKLSKSEREENMRSAFKIKNSKFNFRNANIFLVDDIVTTGVTLKEAANVMKRNGANKVFGLTLARD